LQRSGACPPPPEAVAGRRRRRRWRCGRRRDRGETEFDVILGAAGEKKIQVIKVVRELTGLGSRRPRICGRRAEAGEGEVTKAEAEDMKRSSRSRGATVSVK